MLLQDIAQGAPTAAADPYTRIIGGIIGLIVAATPMWNHYRGKRRDKSQKSAIDELKDALSKQIDDNHRETCATLNAFQLELKDLRAFVVGPDGENGIRGDLRHLKKEMQGLLERERDRLEAKAGYGAYTPRQGT
jgi:hypothetical protein